MAPPKKKAAAKSSSTEPTVDELVDKYVTLAQESLKTYAEIAKNAGKRLAAEDPQPATTWADDLSKLWGTIARDQAMALSLAAQFAQLAATPPKK